MMALEKVKEQIQSAIQGLTGLVGGKTILAILSLLIFLVLGLGMYWDIEPEPFPVKANAEKLAAVEGVEVVTGYTTTATLYTVADIMLHKPGGFLRNDIMPPGALMDNMPSWELGVLVQVRDMARALRKDFSRSQSQSREDSDLAVAEPQFNFDARSWALPSSEKEYERGLGKLASYMNRLPDDQDSAQFYARADNLTRWLSDVETRLGSLSQRLSASVGKPRLNTDLAGDASASQSTENETVLIDIKTPWTQIDDVFYESRGSSWALIHMLRAVEVDFADVLEKKNATVSLRQIIRELEATQDSVWSPMILNGSGFGLLANHSLVMANYISRANAAIIDLRRLLEQG